MGRDSFSISCTQSLIERTASILSSRRTDLIDGDQKHSLPLPLTLTTGRSKMDRPPPLPYIPHHHHLEPTEVTIPITTSLPVPPAYTFEAPPPSYQRERTSSFIYYPGRWTQERRHYCQSTSSSSTCDEEGCSRCEVIFLVLVFIVVATFGIVGGVLDGRGR